MNYSRQRLLYFGKPALGSEGHEASYYDCLALAGANALNKRVVNVIDLKMDNN